MTVPDELTRNANTALGETIANTTPITPAIEPSQIERAGTRRALTSTSQRGASPLSASTCSTREHTYTAELRHDSTAVRMMKLIAALPQSNPMTLSASVNGDSPGTMSVQGTMLTIRNSETT